MSKKELSAVEPVFDYLYSQNRPYSIIDIVLNLHKEHGKTAVQKALEILVQEGRVKEKTYGKQKVYVLNQTGLPQATPEELKHMEAEIENREKRVKTLEGSLKDAQNELKALSSSMTTEQAKAIVEKLTKENMELEVKYKSLSVNGKVVLDKKDRDEIRNKRTKMIGEWKKRKRLCLGMVNQTLEDWPGTKQSLFDEVSLETDEDAGVTIPS